ncbi:hypothetical protein BDR26DRAFT_1007379 [Obelidium mucronatum]|nr:hypothetical protein BDR26DRAFT_1007379 [Obelidium mucronatum]
MMVAQILRRVDTAGTLKKKGSDSDENDENADITDDSAEAVPLSKGNSQNQLQEQSTGDQLWNKEWTKLRVISQWHTLQLKLFVPDFLFWNPVEIKVVVSSPQNMSTNAEIPTNAVVQQVVPPKDASMGAHVSKVVGQQEVLLDALDLEAELEEDEQPLVPTSVDALKQERLISANPNTCSVKYPKKYDYSAGSTSKTPSALAYRSMTEDAFRFLTELNVEEKEKASGGTSSSTNAGSLDNSSLAEATPGFSAHPFEESSTVGNSTHAHTPATFSKALTTADLASATASSATQASTQNVPEFPASLSSTHTPDGPLTSSTTAGGPGSLTQASIQEVAADSTAFDTLSLQVPAPLGATQATDDPLSASILVGSFDSLREASTQEVVDSMTPPLEVIAPLSGQQAPASTTAGSLESAAQTSTQCCRGTGSGAGSVDR